MAIGFPTVPRGKARIRVMISAAHERADLDRGLEAFQAVGKEPLTEEEKRKRADTLIPVEAKWRKNIEEILKQADELEKESAAPGTPATAVSQPAREAVSVQAATPAAAAPQPGAAMSIAAKVSSGLQPMQQVSGYQPTARYNLASPPPPPSGLTMVASVGELLYTRGAGREGDTILRRRR